MTQSTKPPSLPPARPAVETSAKHAPPPSPLRSAADLGEHRIARDRAHASLDAQVAAVWSENYANTIARLVRVGLQRADAEEVVSKAVVHHLEHGLSVSRWFFVVRPMRRGKPAPIEGALRAHWRKARRIESGLTSALEATLPSGSDPSLLVDLLKVMERVEDILPESHVAVVDQTVKGYVDTEIAEDLGISRDAVRTRLSRARMQIRKHFSDAARP